MDLQIFLGKQAEVYGRFANTEKVVAEGLKPSKALVEGQGGYLVALRHPVHVSEAVANFSERISKTVPALVYNARDVHTTISDFNVKTGFQPDKKVLETICDALSYSNRETPLINCNTPWLYNQDSIIVPGIPNETFLAVAQSLNKKALPMIALRMPWGAHMTASRFKSSVSPENLADFFKLMKESPMIGEVKPVAIDVGYFNLDENGFVYTTHERFNL